MGGDKMPLLGGDDDGFFVADILMDKKPEATQQKDRGINWVVAAAFIVADVAGGGVVAAPIAMLRSSK
jgi:hypothetical protein